MMGENKTVPQSAVDAYLEFYGWENVDSDDADAFKRNIVRFDLGYKIFKRHVEKYGIAYMRRMIARGAKHIASHADQRVKALEEELGQSGDALVELGNRLVSESDKNATLSKKLEEAKTENQQLTVELLREKGKLQSTKDCLQDRINSVRHSFEVYPTKAKEKRLLLLEEQLAKLENSKSIGSAKPTRPLDVEAVAKRIAGDSKFIGGSWAAMDFDEKVTYLTAAMTKKGKDDPTSSKD